MRLICGKHKQEHRSEPKLQATEIQVEATKVLNFTRLLKTSEDTAEDTAKGRRSVLLRTVHVHLKIYHRADALTNVCMSVYADTNVYYKQNRVHIRVHFGLYLALKVGVIS